MCVVADAGVVVADDDGVCTARVAVVGCVAVVGADAGGAGRGAAGADGGPAVEGGVAGAYVVVV